MRFALSSIRVSRIQSPVGGEALVGEQPLALVDFNERDRNGYILALIENVSAPVRPGLTIQLRDSDGNLAGGRVVDVDGGLVRIQPDWSKWEAAPEAVEVMRSTLLMVSFLDGAITTWDTGNPEELVEALQARARVVRASVGGSAPALVESK
jgi:hypothetical protein